MVEGSSFGCFRGRRCEEVVGVRDVDLFLAVKDLVAVAGNGVNVVEAICGTMSAMHSRPRQGTGSRTPHAQLLQGIDAARLQQLAYNPIRLL